MGEGRGLFFRKNHWKQSNEIEITRIPLRLRGLGSGFNGYRLVQFSDIHMDFWMTPEHLMEIVQLVNQQEPDLVAITGDFVGRNPARHAQNLVACLSQLRSVDGVVAVLGNHDHWKDPLTVRQILIESQIDELNNRVRTIQRGEEQLLIAGIDDHASELSCLGEVIDQLPANGTAILLAHTPDFADHSAPTGHFALQISGHSHGGQINLPVIGSPYLPRFARKYVGGLYQVGEMLLYTNRGVGRVHLPFRLDSRPEITVFTLNGD